MDEFRKLQKFHVDSMVSEAKKLGRQSKDIEERIEEIRRKSERRRSAFQMLNTQIESLGFIVTAVDNVVNNLANIRNLVEEVEENMMELEDLIEEQETEKKILDAKVQFIIHRERRSKDLDNLKEDIKLEHLSKVKQYELSQMEQLKAKQKQYEQAFQKDVEDFVSKGKLPGRRNCESHLSLEDVIIEDDACSLEEFLSDMNLDSTR
ncbi:dysbindin-like isoform X1 [Artemia franciscana]|uniref:dysbindin-like isoform X1 n=1 Tax=Artemia franciscana TaxID=6661 RepID=UPI0032DB987F